ncbi:MAG: class I SAM-dependent methyltransferase [Spirochaetales bacterium]|nr:class I SAM-dependent methyltransferase [Spirochaetales bacterium]
MAGIGAFDEHFRDYEQWFSEHGSVYRCELRAVGHMLPASGDGLEVGVGSGKFAEPFGIKFGVEPSRAMRRLAESRGVEVCGGVAEELPFDDGRFAFVLMVTTICFLDDPDRAFQEVRRVLTDGGVVVVGFVDKDSPLGRIYQEHKDENPFYREATFYSTAEVLALLQRNGFTQPQVIQTVFGKLNEIHTVQDFKSGWGEGGFVTVRACKTH